MGTPEFPDLGKHCYVEDCKQIDFLPFTCDACRKVFCLEHRSYAQHQCPNADIHDITVVICPLCAKGVRLEPGQDPNLCWESHASTECDPSNYERATKRKKCPVHRCKETLTFSNTIKCRDCSIEHCLRHRFGPDHRCPGPKKPDTKFPLINRSSTSLKQKLKANQASGTSSPKWTTRFNTALTRIGSEISQAWLQNRGESGSGGCPHCSQKFSKANSLVEHVKKVHDKNSNQKGATKSVVDVCPKCSKGFLDAVALVEHVEKEHSGSSGA